MPPIRTDADQAGQGYQVAPIEFNDGDVDGDGISDGDGDFRLLSIKDHYERLMLEDEQSLEDAATGWDALGHQFFYAASALRSSMATLSDTWQSDAATLLGERVAAAASSFDAWGYVAVDRSRELVDLARELRNGKMRLEQLFIEFNATATALITPPADQLAADHSARAEAADDPAIELNLRTWTERSLDEVVNPLANRFSEAALAFTVAGSVYGGPTNAAAPSAETRIALSMGQWSPSMPSMPGGPGTPAVPARPAPQAVPDPPAAPSAAALTAALRAVGVPVAPAAPAVPPGAVRSSVPAMPDVPAGATLSSLVAAGWLGAPALAGRRAPVVPTAPTVPGAPAAPGVRSPGVPAAVSAPGRPGAAPPALPGRAGGAATPGLHPSSGAPGAPLLPGRPGPPPGAAPPPTPRLPGRSSPSGASPPPPPSLPGSTRPRTDVPAAPGTRAHGTRTPGHPAGPNRPAAPTGPHLLGRDAPTGAPPATTPPPPALGNPRRPGERTERPSSRPTDPTRPGPQRVVDLDPSVPTALRSARTTGTPRLPDPAPNRAASADPRLSVRPPSTPVPPPTNAAPPPAARTADQPVSGRHRAAGARPATTDRPDRTARSAAAGQPEPRTPSTAWKGTPPTARSTGPGSATPARSGDGHELGGRTATEPAAPTRAEERAAERARRRAEWIEARRRHEATLTR